MLYATSWRLSNIFPPPQPFRIEHWNTILFALTKDCGSVTFFYEQKPDVHQPPASDCTMAWPRPSSRDFNSLLTRCAEWIWTKNAAASSSSPFLLLCHIHLNVKGREHFGSFAEARLFLLRVVMNSKRSMIHLWDFFTNVLPTLKIPPPRLKSISSIECLLKLSSIIFKHSEKFSFSQPCCKKILC